MEVTGRWRHSPACATYEQPLSFLFTRSAFFLLTQLLCRCTKTGLMFFPISKFSKTTDLRSNLSPAHHPFLLPAFTSLLSMLCTEVWSCFLMSLGTSGSVILTPSVVPAHAARLYCAFTFFYSDQRINRNDQDKDNELKKMKMKIIFCSPKKTLLTIMMSSFGLACSHRFQVFDQDFCVSSRIC